MIQNEHDYMLLLDFMMIFVNVVPCWFPVSVIFPEIVFKMTRRHQKGQNQKAIYSDILYISYIWVTIFNSVVAVSRVF